MTDLAICRFMGWTIADVHALDPDTFDVLVDEMTKHSEPDE